MSSISGHEGEKRARRTTGGKEWRRQDRLERGVGSPQCKAAMTCGSGGEWGAGRNRLGRARGAGGMGLLQHGGERAGGAGEQWPASVAV